MCRLPVCCLPACRLCRLSFLSLLITALACIAAFYLSSAAQAQPGPPPSIALAVGEPTEEPVVLEASGLTPEGEVLWVWLERWPRGAYSATFSGERLDRADAAGVAALERPEGVTLRSLFLVVDLETGEMAAGTPVWGDGVYEPRLVDLPPGAWVAAEASGGRGPLLRLPMRHAWVVLARPDRGRGASGSEEPADGESDGSERGVWKREGIDGGEEDEDGAANGVFEAATASFVPVEPEGGARGEEAPAGPPPERLRPTDLLVAFDLESLTVLVSDVGRGAAGAGAVGSVGSEGNDEAYGAAEGGVR